jgi:NRPS condensation-like uncharacterized protein
MLNEKGNSRPLGYVESVQYVLNSYAKILRNVVVSVELDKSFNKDSIYQFLENAFNTFKALQTRIQEINSIPHLFANINFSSIPITISQDDNYNNQLIRDEIEKSMSISINTNSHMWQARIIDCPDRNILILTFHHSIFDGKSIIKLLDILNKNKSIERNNSEIHRPIENDIDRRYTNKQICEDIHKNDVMKWIKPSFVCSTKNQISKCRVLNLDFVDVNKMRKYSSFYNVTVNDVLNALIIKSISKVSSKLEKLLVHTPSDLSSHSNNPEHSAEIGCFITVIHSIIQECKNMSLLEIARAYRFSIKTSPINIKESFNYHNLKNDLIKDFDKDTEGFTGGIALSNIGIITSNDHIKNIYFSTSLTGGLGIFVISILTFNNTFKATISYTTPLVTEKFISKFCTQLLKEFYKLNNEINSAGESNEV